MKAPYRRAADVDTTIQVARTLHEGSVRNKEYKPTAWQKYVANLEISGRSLDDVDYDHYHDIDAKGKSNAERSGTAHQSGDPNAAKYKDTLDGDDSGFLRNSEEARRLVKDADPELEMQNLQAIFAQSPMSSSAVKDFFNSILNLDPPSTNSSHPVRAVGPPWPHPDAPLVLKGGSHGLDGTEQRDFASLLKKHAHCHVITEGERTLADVLHILGARNAESSGWCMTLEHIKPPQQPMDTASPPQSPSPSSPPIMHLHLYDTRAARSHGRMADGSEYPPLADLPQFIGGPLARKLTTRCSNVAVFPSPTTSLSALLAAFAGVAQIVMEASRGGLVVIPHCEGDYEPGHGSNPGASKVWFVLAKCEKDRPDRLSNLAYELTRVGRERSEGLTQRK